MKFSRFITTALALFSITTLSAQAAAPASYNKCVACHQPTGAGLPNVFPPLAGSEWVNGPVENLIRIQLRGLMGPITVAGKQYSSAMPPNATMTDEEIAEVLTYIRSSWGNKASAVTPDMVKALRSEVGKPMLTVADLIDPATAPKEEPKKAEPETSTETGSEESTSDKPAAAAKSELKSGEFKDVQEEDSNLPWWVFGFFGVCAAPVAISLVSKK